MHVSRGGFSLTILASRRMLKVGWDVVGRRQPFRAKRGIMHFLTSIEQQDFSLRPK
jgi:hypothetical protein